jgi:beta-galactosidase GanA
LDGQIAITVHPFGKGMVYFIGAYLDEKAQQTLIEHILQMAGIQGIKTDEDVEVTTRFTPEGKAVSIVINHAQVERIYNLPWLSFEHLTGQPVQGDLILLPYAVAILTKVE